MAKEFVVSITGASGAVYGRRLVDLLERAGAMVQVIVTEAGADLLERELGVMKLNCEELIGRVSERVVFHDDNCMADVLASGSHKVEGMVVCPCSANSMAAMAAGICNSLSLRAAQVSLKQRRRLVVVHRETPLSEIDIENMLRLSRAGAIIMPAAPGFYLGPKSIDDLVDMLVGRILDLLGVEHDVACRWEP